MRVVLRCGSGHANQWNEPVSGFSTRHNMMSVDWHWVKRGVARTPIVHIVGVASDRHHFQGEGV